jgi:putative hydrolase of the HAD superfamily
MKQAWGDRLTTVFPRQGHYAHDERLTSQFPAADLSVEHVADLVDCNYEDFAGSA